MKTVREALDKPSARQVRWPARRRLVHINGYMKRGALLIEPNLELCGGALVVHVTVDGLVHVTDNVLVPASYYYPSVREIVAGNPDLSIYLEALLATDPLRGRGGGPAP
eukprot:5690490-Pyramimonas_sp.AAC.1